MFFISPRTSPNFFVKSTPALVQCTQLNIPTFFEHTLMFFVFFDRGGVNSLAIHPSGKLALSAGHDMSLRTWNLIKGRVAYTTNMKQCKCLTLLRSATS